MVWGRPASSNLLWLFAAHLLRQERSNFPLVFLEPQAFLAPGPRPAAGCVLISAVSSKGQPPLSMLSSPIYSAYLLAPRGLRWQTVPSGQGEEAGRGLPMLPLCPPPRPQRFATLGQLGCFQEKHVETFRADPRWMPRAPA